MIEYHFEAEAPGLDLQKYTDWITSVILAKGNTTGDLTYVFCSDEYLLDMNRKYLQHDYYTDIITFPSESSGEISGEIYISLDRVRDNAGKFNTDELDELRRVMIHGVLHLLGFADDTPETKAIMRKEEDLALEMFHVKH